MARHDFSTEPTKVTVIFTKQDITPGTKDWRKSVLYRSIVDLLMNRTMWANLILSYMTCLNVNKSLIQCLRASSAESLRWIWWLCHKVMCCLQHERIVHKKWLITQLCAIVWERSINPLFYSFLAAGEESGGRVINIVQILTLWQGQVWVCC